MTSTRIIALVHVCAGGGEVLGSWLANSLPNVISGTPVQYLDSHSIVHARSHFGPSYGLFGTCGSLAPQEEQYDASPDALTPQ